MLSMCQGLEARELHPSEEGHSAGLRVAECITLVIQALHAWLRFMHFIIEIYVRIYIYYIVYIYICLNVCNLFGTLNFEANFEGGPYIYICIHLFIFCMYVYPWCVCVCVCLCVCVSDLMCSDKVLSVVRWWIVPPDVACYGSVVKGKRDFAVVRFQW